MCAQMYHKGLPCFSVFSHRGWNLGNGKIYDDRTYYFCAESDEVSDWMSILKKTGLRLVA